MTGPTHRVYAVFFAYIATMIVYTYNIINVNYYLCLTLFIVLSKRGAIFPDLDHAWCNIGDKSGLNKVINTLIHITGGKHRSWQTHSLDIYIIYTVVSYIIPSELYKRGIINDINYNVTLIILLGFSSGWLSHLFSDMLNHTGIRLVCWSKKTIKFVPKKIGKLRFNTGNEWESFNFKVISFLNKIIGIICLIYPLGIKYGTYIISIIYQ